MKNLGNKSRICRILLVYSWIEFFNFLCWLLVFVLVARLKLEIGALIWEPLSKSSSQMHSLISELQKLFCPGASRLPSLLMHRHSRQNPWRNLKRRHFMEPLQVWPPLWQRLQLRHFGAFQSGWHLSRAVYERSASWVAHRAVTAG